MGGHVGMGVGGMPLVGLVGWGFMLGCSDTVGSLQLESHHSWLARGVPSSPFCAHVFYPCSFEAFNISLSCDQKLMVSPFFSLPFPHWHMMTPLLLQLFRRPSWINAQESREEIWIKWKKNPINSSLSSILTYRCNCNKPIGKLITCSSSFYHCAGARAYVCSFPQIKCHWCNHSFAIG